MTFFCKARRQNYPSRRTCYSSFAVQKNKISLRHRAMRGCGVECNAGSLNRIFSIKRGHEFRVACRELDKYKLRCSVSVRRTNTLQWWWGNNAH